MTMFIRKNEGENSEELPHELIGKIAKLTKLGVDLEREYEQLFKVGDYQKIKSYFEDAPTGLHLIFVAQPPFKISNLRWYCLKEIGNPNSDLFWFTLEQLLICDIQKPSKFCQEK